MGFGNKDEDGLEWASERLALHGSAPGTCYYIELINLLQAPIIDDTLNSGSRTPVKTNSNYSTIKLLLSKVYTKPCRAITTCTDLTWYVPYKSRWGNCPRLAVREYARAWNILFSQLNHCGMLSLNSSYPEIINKPLSRVVFTSEHFMKYFLEFPQPRNCK